jgi:hypothetical protein
MVRLQNKMFQLQCKIQILMRINQSLKHEFYHVLVSHPSLMFLFFKHDFFPLEDDPPTNVVV